MCSLVPKRLKTVCVGWVEAHAVWRALGRVWGGWVLGLCVVCWRVCLLVCRRVFCLCVSLGVFCGFGFCVFSCVVSCAVCCVLMDFRLPSFKNRSFYRDPTLP